jgi:hypothetical protein
VVYDAFGDIISIMQQNICIVHATDVSIEAVNVTIKGALTVTETFNVQKTGGVSALVTIIESANISGDVVAGARQRQHWRGDGPISHGLLDPKQRGQPARSLSAVGFDLGSGEEIR